MVTGYIALIDVLGFKGIWKRTDPEDVVMRMERLRSTMKRVNSFQFTDPLSIFEDSVKELLTSQDIQFNISLLSDTIAIGVGTDSNPQQSTDKFRDRVCLSILSLTLRTAIQHWAEFDPPYSMRGCIAYGEFLIRDSILLGPAVDESAEWYEQSEGAFVWMSESAYQNHMKCKLFLGNTRSAFRKWKVPLKKEIRETYALNPLADSLFLEITREEVYGRIIASFGKEPSGAILEKKTNTEKYLDFLRKHDKTRYISWDLPN